MVHDKLDALRLGIVAQVRQIKVGVRGDEVEHLVLETVRPVLPADVPSLHQYGIEAMLGGEVDIPLSIGGGGAMASVGLNLCPVHLVDVRVGQVVGVAPFALAGDHLPPYAHILAGLDPRGVLDFARVVEVVGDARGQDVAGVVADDDGTPGRCARGLHVGFHASGVGGEIGL